MIDILPEDQKLTEAGGKYRLSYQLEKYQNGRFQPVTDRLHSIIELSPDRDNIKQSITDTFKRFGNHCYLAIQNWVLDVRTKSPFEP